MQLLFYTNTTTDRSASQAEESVDVDTKRKIARLLKDVNTNIGNPDDFRSGEAVIRKNTVEFSLDTIALQLRRTGVPIKYTFECRYDFDCRLIFVNANILSVLAEHLPKKFSLFFPDLPMPDSLPTNKLPDKPPALWPGARILQMSFKDAVAWFLRVTYLPYINSGVSKEEIRDYIYANDYKLYVAIRDYQKKDHVLPEDIRLPSRLERMDSLFDRASKEGLESLSPKELVAVARKIRRDRDAGPS
jgi:hypothetical protein